LLLEEKRGEYLQRKDRDETSTPASQEMARNKEKAEADQYQPLEGSHHGSQCLLHIGHWNFFAT
jgi:hypothetical protein